jgi:hypothetical protein
MPTQRWTRKIGGLAAALGLSVFLFDTRIVPRILGFEYAYKNVYTQYGNIFFEILLSPLQQPALWFKQLFGPERIQFLFWTLMPLGFLPLLNPVAFIAALPGYLMLFLSLGTGKVSIHYHYAIEPSIGLFFSLPGALLNQIGTKNSRLLRHLPIWILFWALAGSGRSELHRIRTFSPSLHHRWITQQVLPCLHLTAPWVASETLAPWLSARHWIHVEERELPNNPIINCWITDRSMSHWPLASPEDAINRIPADFYNKWSCGPISVFQRKTSNDSCMSCIPQCDS